MTLLLLLSIFARAACVLSMPSPSARELSVIKQLEVCLWSNHTVRRQPRAAPLSMMHSAFAPFIELPGLLDSEDVALIRSLAQCMYALQPESLEVRSFRKAGEEEEYTKGNTCTFLSSYMIRLLPEIVEHLLTSVEIATNHAGWRPSPLSLGLRTLEFIQYDAGENLALHEDRESVYTLIVMLSNPRIDFTGAHFFIKPRLEGSGRIENKQELIALRPPQFSGLLFDSLATHGLNDVESGHREIFALELWDYPTEIDGRRPSAPTDRFHSPRMLHTVSLLMHDSHDL